MHLTEEQIFHLKQHWPLADEIKFHRRVANFVYFATIENKEVVLRLTEPHHRKQHEIHSELDWINYLSGHHMKIASPVKTFSGSYIVELPGTQPYFAVVFNKAPGSFLKDDVNLKDDIIKTWGQYVGRMHRLTKNYKPDSSIIPRQQWEQDESLMMALRSHDKNDDLPYRRMNEILEWMRCLPKENPSYGLVHCDLHRGNFFVKNDQITAFDFDDACYQWFSYDIVAPINSINNNIDEGVFNLEKETALNMFLVGYNSENSLEKIWIDRIPIFDKYRAVLIYHWIKTCIQENIFDSNGIDWAKKKLPYLFETLKEPFKLF